MVTKRVWRCSIEAEIWVNKLNITTTNDDINIVTQRIRWLCKEKKFDGRNM